MRKIEIFGIVTLLIISIVATGALAVSFGGGRMQMLDEDSDLNKAIESGDYDAFLVAAEEANRGNFVDMTEDEFNSLVERHSEMKEHREEIEEIRSKIDSSIESGDYDAWKIAIADAPNAEELLEKITEDNFDRFAEMHNARVSGDFETAKEIAEELGLEKRWLGQGNRDGMRSGQMSGNHQKLGSLGEGNCDIKGERFFQGKGNGRMIE